MRFFFISPQQKISSFHTGNETDSEFEVFSKRMTFWNIKSNFISFSLHTQWRSSAPKSGGGGTNLSQKSEKHKKNVTAA